MLVVEPQFQTEVPGLELEALLSPVLEEQVSAKVVMATLGHSLEFWVLVVWEQHWPQEAMEVALEEVQFTTMLELVSVQEDKVTLLQVVLYFPLELWELSLLEH